MKQKTGALRIGLIGCGRVAVEHHLPSLRKVANAEIVAVADTDYEKATLLAERHQIAACYGHPRDLLADKRVEAVGVLTPTSSHYQIGIAALQAGKHVFMEKPLALSRSECDQLIRAWRQSGKMAMTCFNLRWHRHVQKAKEIVASGRLGTIKGIISTYTHNRDIQNVQEWHKRQILGGGVTFNEGVHHYDLWRFLLEKDVCEAFAFQRGSAHFEDETSVFSGRLSNGILASCFSTFKTSPANEIQIIGTAGRLCIDLYRFDGWNFFPSSIYSGSIGHRLKRSLQNIGQCIEAVSAKCRGGGFAETFYHAWDHFVRCLREGKEPGCTFDDGRQAVLTALAAIESFRSGQLTRVDEENQLPVDIDGQKK
jgi:predicted dehydrogenase